MIAEARDALPELPAARARALRLRGRALRGGRDDPRLPGRVRRVLRAGAGAPRTAPRPKAIANWVTGELVAACARPGRRTRSPRRRPPRRSRRWPAWSRRRRSPTAPASRCWRSWSPRAATRRRSSRARASPRSPTPASWRRSSTRRSRPSPRPPSRSGGQREGDRPDRGRGDEGDQGPRRRRRGPTLITRARRLEPLVTSCYKAVRGHTEAMAWNVVIAGGGFAGATCAHELERLLPTQSARLTLVNDVNFMLYTPFLPEAAAGTAGAAPRRHAAARDPRPHLPAPRRGHRATTPPRAPSSCATHEGETEELRYDQLVALGRLGLADAAGPGPRPSTRSGSRASPTRSGCATTWSRRSSMANATEDPQRRERAAHLRLRRRRLRRASRRWPSCRTSPPTRWTATRARGCTGCAGSSSRRATACCPRSTRRSPTTRCASCAAAGSRSGSGPRSRRSTADSARALDRRDGPDPDRRLDRRRRAAPEPRATSRCRSTSAAGSSVDDHLRVRGAATASGRSATAPRSPTPAAASPRRPRSTASARRSWSRDNIAAALGTASRRAATATRASTAFVNLGRYKAVGRIGEPHASRASSPGGWPAPTT